MRPGAALAPAAVWHELQSPLVTVPTIERRAAPRVTATVHGDGHSEKMSWSRKLPDEFTGSVCTAPMLSTISTCTSVTPRHRSGSWYVG